MAKLTLTALKLIANPNDNRLFVKVLPADNVYVTGGVQLNLTPGSILDPNALGVVGPSQVPAVCPGVFSENMTGITASVVPATGGLSTYKLKYYNADGTEFAAGAYSAAITGGTLILEIPYES